MPKNTFNALFRLEATAIRFLLGMAAACFFASASPAIEVLSVDVRLDGDVYHLHGQSIIEAPPDFIFSVLMDYDNFHRMADGIAETRFLEPAEDGRRQGYTRINSCVWFFCRQFEKVERIQASAPTSIQTEIVPEESDFKMNSTRWTLQPIEAGTLVTYEAEMDPAFWIPPLIGPWALKKKLAESAESIGGRIEYLLESGQSPSEFTN